MTSAAPAAVSCLLVDDHPAVLDAVSRVLAGAGIRIVCTTSSGADGLAMLERRPADVALIDLRLPDMDGFELVQAIARSPVPARSLLYTGYAGWREAGKALAVGASGVITKGSPLSEVVRAVLAVGRGGTYVDPLLGGQLALQGIHWAKLSERDELFLEYVAQGLTDERIGEELHLSSETVRANVRRVVQAVGARNRTHAVAVALRTGQIR